MFSSPELNKLFSVSVKRKPNAQNTEHKKNIKKYIWNLKLKQLFQICQTKALPFAMTSFRFIFYVIIFDKLDYFCTSLTDFPFYKVSKIKFRVLL